ncbi:MAG: hypothetical protein GDA47_01415 [Rhodospirillales bacterium]|nr:hypothetical protein [Rhodospirillales bacterium]
MKETNVPNSGIEPVLNRLAGAVPDMSPQPSRARWLRSLAKGGQEGALHAQMAESLLGSLEALFAFVVAEAGEVAAESIERFHAERARVGFYWGGRER